MTTAGEGERAQLTVRGRTVGGEQKQLTRVLTQKMAELVDANAQDVLSFKEALHSLVVDTLPTDWSLSPQATGLTGAAPTRGHGVRSFPCS